MFLVDPMSIRTALFRYWRLPFADKATLVEAVVCLAIARFLIRFIPLKRWSWVMGRARREADAPRSNDDVLQARKIGRIVRMASRWVPWNAVCLPQAIAAKIMLARRRIQATLYVGLRRAVPPDGTSTADDIELHAWLRVGHKVITGGEVSADFRALISYS